ncbi:MAG: excinuclease ABC subunit UvrA [Deltaproteobacteria bacterium]|nr:excinuclease ABC subunit UvrA [Deltaproteobacteria bacterium]MCL5277761.1 excinuclease ABC subunit UvrA [Deltaproteobacteria bacterium]
MAMNYITVRGAREHNLKGIDVDIPRNKLVVITGLSGSGKSTLAFDTIYAEGQRRYVESLSAYARQFLGQMDKPDVDSIEGLSPAISIEQRTLSHNPRSTVGTVTEIYDYLRVLYARIGTPHCPVCGRELASQGVDQMVDRILSLDRGTRLMIMAPVVRGDKGEFKKELLQWRKNGYTRAKVDDTIVELQDDIRLDKNKKHRISVIIDRITVGEGMHSRVADSVETALAIADGIVEVGLVDGETVPLEVRAAAGADRGASARGTEGGAERGHMPRAGFTMSQRFACPDCGTSLPELAPRIFSFNSPYGACENCDGIGHLVDFTPELIVPDGTLSVRKGAVAPWRRRSSFYLQDMLDSLENEFGIDLDVPFGQLPEWQRYVILYGTKDIEKQPFASHVKRHHYPFPGVIPYLQRKYREEDDPFIVSEIQKYLHYRVCTVCSGARLKKESLSVTINGKNIHEFTRMTIEQAYGFIKGIPLTGKQRLIAERLLKEIESRIEFMFNVGLDYISLDRMAGTLSGGEYQRIRLATQVGSGLVGVLYILDEPTIGLHQRDNRKLINTLFRLRDIGNTVIVVEHDPDTILSSDYVIDMGPGAGHKGGEVVAEGTPAQIMENGASLTGRYLSGGLSIPVPHRRRQTDRGLIRLYGASTNNLRNIDVSFPVGVFTCVTGVSGSGKSSLVVDTLYNVLYQKLNGPTGMTVHYRKIEGVELVDKVIQIDQSPIGRTPRSNAVTYTGVFDQIREVFSQTQEARARGYTKGRFSFNLKGGRCDVCEGQGMSQIEMHFLPDIYVQCDGCKGRRYNRETLEVYYKGKNISDVLGMSVEEALEFFKNIPAIKDKLGTLYDVGLDYLKLGQSATTLSGGEAQRIKLSKELGRRSTGKTVYILDEPTTGLHFDDIKKLLNVLSRLVEEGNTVVVIEHNLDVIKSADFVIDLGPEGGEKGGGVVATGTPEEIAGIQSSYTGEYLKAVLR